MARRSLKPKNRETVVRWWRLVAVAVVTYLIASAVLAPQLNPFFRGKVFPTSEEASVIAAALSEVRFAQSLAAEVMPIDEGEVTFEQLGFGAGQNRFTQLELVPPNELRARLARIGLFDDELLASEMILTMDLESREWSCQVEGAWPDRLLPVLCRRTPPTDPVTILSWLLGLSIAGILVLGGILWFANPLVRPLERNTGSLLRIPAPELPKTDRVLRVLRRRDTLLNLAGVDRQDWQEAAVFANELPARRAELLASRLQARSETAGRWNLRGPVFEWRFVRDLPVSLQQVAVYFPAPGLVGRELVQYLRSQQTALNVVLIVTETPNAALEAFCRESAQLFAYLDPASQTEILLGPEPQTTLVRALARQLPVTRISPYQTRGGITRPSAFFGRRQLLTRIINREPANYLVVGGRQLGKTSLLKAVERQLEHQPDTRCLYLSLRDHRLAPRLATRLGLEPTDDLDEVLRVLDERNRDGRVLLLIDEADPFMAHEARTGYQQLSALRAASDEGRCHFVLAGFWELFAAATLDYQSPVRNFGEVLTIGALEPEACRKLAAEPLGVLGIRFAQEALVDEIVLESGGRANLIAIICQECLEQLEAGRDVIGARELSSALRSQPVSDALSGWTRLSSDPVACRIDRAIVYLLASEGELLLPALLERFADRWAATDIHASLQRLRLAFVIDQQGQQLAFAVPLFARQLDADEAGAYLKSELAQSD